MIGPASPSWPNSRVLTAWRPLLERLHAKAAWVHHLHLHRVEAPVMVARPAREAFNRLLLEAAAACRSGDELTRLLHVEASLLRRILADLVDGGLMACLPDGRWTLTVTGQQALADQRLASVAQERRIFWFVEGPTSHPGTRFLPLDNPPAFTSEEPDLRFDIATLRDCAMQSTAWKQAHVFPLDVCGLASSGRHWRDVAIHQTAKLTLLVVVNGDEDERLIAFAVRPSDWELAASHPVLTLRAGWREVLPELVTPVQLQQWRAAWQTWAESRHLPLEQLDQCHIEQSGLAIVVRPPPPLLERLQSLPGDFWLLAGSGLTRAIASLEIAGV